MLHQNGPATVKTRRDHQVVTAAGSHPDCRAVLIQIAALHIEARPELPGDPEDEQSRYIEAAVEGLLIGCLYLPNGNPAPGPKFDYKLRWFERLLKHAAQVENGPVFNGDAFDTWLKR